MSTDLLLLKDFFFTLKIFEVWLRLTDLVIGLGLVEEQKYEG